MKKLSLSALILLFVVGNAFSQNSVIKNIFDKFSNDNSFESIYVSGKMLESFTKSEKINKIKELDSKLTGLNILKTSKNHDSFYTSVNLQLSNSKLEEYLKIKEKDTNVSIFTDTNSDKIAREVILLIKEADETILISFLGNINIDEISNLSNTFK